MLKRHWDGGPIVPVSAEGHRLNVFWCCVNEFRADVEGLLGRGSDGRGRLVEVEQDGVRGGAGMVHDGLDSGVETEGGGRANMRQT